MESLVRTVRVREARRLWAVLSLGLLACPGCGSGHSTGAPLPLRASILVEITPGKPDAPTEEIEARKAGSEIRLRVVRRQGDQVLAQGAAPLTAGEFQSVWREVEREDLFLFQPAPSGAVGADFGERRLKLERQGRLPEELDAVWTEEISNQAGVAELFARLAVLAGQKAPQVKLFYFPAR